MIKGNCRVVLDIGTSGRDKTAAIVMAKNHVSKVKTRRIRRKKMLGMVSIGRSQ
jgi:hypothetical protein